MGSRVGRVLLLLLVAVALPMCSAQLSCADDQLKTWKDVSGEFSVEAKLVAVRQGKVILVRKDKIEIAVPIELLDRASLLAVVEHLQTAQSKAAVAPNQKPAKLPMGFLEKVQKAAEEINKLPTHSHEKTIEIGGPVFAHLRNARLNALPGGPDLRDRAHQARPIKTWYLFRGFQNTLTYKVNPGTPVIVRYRGDECPGKVNLYGDIGFVVSEQVDGAWKTQKTVDGPRNFCGYRLLVYTPKTDQIRLVGQRACGFYVEVYDMALATERPAEKAPQKQQ